MEERIAILEEFAADTPARLARIEARVEQTVARADWNAAIISVIKWMVGTAALLAASGISIMTFALSNAAPRHPHRRPLPCRCRRYPLPNSQNSASWRDRAVLRDLNSITSRN